MTPSKRHRVVTSIQLTRAIVDSGLIDPDPNHIAAIQIEIDPADVAKILVTYIADSRILSLAHQKAEESAGEGDKM